jgi:hypothetical protein
MVRLATILGRRISQPDAKKPFSAAQETLAPQHDSRAWLI